MKFTCLQENLVRGLSVVSKAVATRGSLPVLSNVLLSAKDGRLKLSATNLETSITTWVGASVDEEGEVTVPSKVFHEFIANLAPSTITVEGSGSSLKVTSDKVSSKFVGLDASEFPSISIDTDDIHLSIDPKVFSEAVLETAFASAVDETRPVLTGVLLNGNKEGLSLVGVDGFRLAERIISSDSGKLKKEFSAIIPSKILLEVARLTSSLKEPLEVSVNKDNTMVVFKSGDVVVSSRVIDGDFPAYKGLIPDAESSTIKVKMAAKDLASALKLANVFAKDSVTVVRFKISSDDSAVYILSSNNEVGENSAKVDAEVTGGDLEIAFNSKYILDALSNVKSDEFIFECSEKVGPGVPGVLRPVARDNHLYLVMPMQY